MLDHPLNVLRKLTDGNSVLVGQLAENATGIYFQYAQEYLDSGLGSIAPFTLRFDDSLQKGDRSLNKGLHGVFADSLPDGWGLYLMDKVFKNNGINPFHVSPLERLAFIGDNTLGALHFEPESQIAISQHTQDIIALGNEAINEFQGAHSSLIDTLMQTGGSGGARPKMNITKLADDSYTTDDKADGCKLIIKLSTSEFALGLDESVVEYSYMLLAKHCGFDVPHNYLFDSGNGQYWLAQERFDCVGSFGRKHLVSASGLTDTNFRLPALDYDVLMNISNQLCSSKAAFDMLDRGLFNYLMVNQDDHGKNFCFLHDGVSWSSSPFYDIVYSPSATFEHATSFNGNGKSPSMSDFVKLAQTAGATQSKAIAHITEKVEHILDCKSVALEQIKERAKNKDITVAIEREILSRSRQLLAK